VVVVGGRGPAAQSLRLSLGLLAATVLILGGAEVALLAQVDGVPLWLPVGFTMLGVVYAAAGIVAWWRRPSNRTGALLVAGGVSFIVAGLFNTDHPLLVAAGTALGTVPLAVVVHLLHAFPSGRLPSTASRAVVAVTYALALIGPAPRYLFTPLPPPDGLLAVADRPDLAAWSTVFNALGALSTVATAVILVERLRRASRPRRRVLAPLYGYGALSTVAVPVLARVQELLGLTDLSRGALQLIVVGGVPLAFVAVLLRGGFARTGEIEELGAWLGSERDARPALADALAATLGDPSVQVLFRVDHGGLDGLAEGYVDADGTPVELPVPGSGRAAVGIDEADRRVGAIVYDATLIADPEPVRAAGQVVGLAVRAERLTAELRASREALRGSRVRLVEAGDRERRRIAQDLHDGLQVQLVLLALDAGQVAKSAADAADVPTRDAATALRTGIDDAAATLRRTVHSVMPAALIERGLSAATEDLVDRLPLPARLELHVTDGTLAAPVEATAYFVLAEALANALKHADAAELAVRVVQEDGQVVVEVRDDGVGGAGLEGGTGLRGLADRVDVLGGRLRLHSPAGGGTCLVAELPCGS
jgi:signal transduction histidine kinase